MPQKKFGVFIAILASSVLTVPHAVSGLGSGVVYGPNAFGPPNAPGRDYGGLHADDDISTTRMSSYLRPQLDQTGSVNCSGPQDPACASGNLQVYAILPPCVTAAQVDCVEALSASLQNGQTASASFVRHFPAKGKIDFVGDAASGLPTGTTPSIWTLPEAPHNAGTDYIVTVTSKGTYVRGSNKLSDFELSASIFPVKITEGAFERVTPSGRGWNSSMGTWNCAVTDDGYCAARQDFPDGARFSVAIRLSTSPLGWLHGRIQQPTIDFDSTPARTRLVVAATPVSVAGIGIWKACAELPPALAAVVRCGLGGATATNPQGAGAHTAIEDWRAQYSDTATWVRKSWMFKSLNGRYSVNCLSDLSTFYGFVTTNATGYAAGPPNYDSSTKTFTYTVGAPHFDDKGNVLKGTYDFVVRSSAARCLFNLPSGLLSGEVSVLGSSGVTQDSVISSVVDDGNWLKMSAAGFHFSTPTVSSRIIGPNVSSSSTNSGPQLKIGRSASAKTIAKLAKMQLNSSSKITLSSPSKTCRIRGGSVIGVRVGKCSVTVIVRTGKKTLRSKPVVYSVTK